MSFYDNVISTRFDDVFFEDEKKTVIPKKTFIDIRIQKRNSKKYHTIIEGLTDTLDTLKKMLKHFKKTLVTNGVLINDPDFGWIIQLQGDHRYAVQEFLVSNKFYEFDQFRMHGY